MPLAIQNCQRLLDFHPDLMTVISTGLVVCVATVLVGSSAMREG